KPWVLVTQNAQLGGGVLCRAIRFRRSVQGATLQWQNIVVSLQKAAEFVVFHATPLQLGDAREMLGINVGVGLCAAHCYFAAPADFKFGKARVLSDWN